MQGKTFKTPEGKINKVLLFDEINKMAYINLVCSQHRWVHEPEYKTWIETDIYGNFIPDTPSQMTAIQEEVYELEHQHIDTSDKSIYENPAEETKTEEEKPKRKRIPKEK